MKRKLQRTQWLHYQTSKIPTKEKDAVITICICSFNNP